MCRRAPPLPSSSYRPPSCAHHRDIAPQVMAQLPVPSSSAAVITFYLPCRRTPIPHKAPFLRPLASPGLYETMKERGKKRVLETGLWSPCLSRSTLHDMASETTLGQRKAMWSRGKACMKYGAGVLGTEGLHIFRIAEQRSLWRDKEDRDVIEAHKIYGNIWPAIATCLSAGHTQNSVNNHWNATMQRLCAKSWVKKKRTGQVPCGQVTLLEEYIINLQETFARSELLGKPSHDEF